MRRRLLVAVAVLVALVPRSSLAELLSPPASPPAAAVVDLASGVVRVFGRTFPIGLPHQSLPSEKSVTVEDILVGRGRNLVHVRVPKAGASTDAEVAWELLLSKGDGPPLFEGLTGYTEGEVGERTGHLLQVLPASANEPGATRYVVLGDLREDVQLCGKPYTLLAPRVVLADTLQFGRASVQRLSEQEQADAEVLTAMPVADPKPPLAELLSPRASSSEDSPASAMFDRDPNTVWSEASNGVGQGEFAIAKAPSAVPLTKLRFTLPEPQGDIVLPRRLFVLVDGARFSVEFPEVPRSPSVHAKAGDAVRSLAFDVTFPKPVRTGCLSVVLGEAYRGARRAPTVAIAGVEAFSAFDDQGLERTTKALAGTDAQADEAQAFLSRAGGRVFEILLSAWPSLDVHGRARAVDIAAAVAACETSAQLYARAAADADSTLSRKGEQRLARCGEKGIPSLLPLLKTDVSVRVATANTVALFGGAKTLVPLAALLGDGPTEARRAARTAVATAAREAVHDEIAQLFWLKTGSSAARLDLLRALRRKLPLVRAEADASISELLREAPPFETRYLVLDAVGALAADGDTAATALLSRFMVDDPAVPVRVRAVTLAADVRDLSAAVLAAASDKSPRVREAAFRALEQTKAKEALPAALAAMRNDGWTFVRLAAVDAASSLGPSKEVDEVLLYAVEHDAIPSMRAAVISALGARGVVQAKTAIRDRLLDPIEDTAVRGAAAQAASALCDHKAVPGLTELANELVAPDATGGARELALVALRALGRLHPADLDRRIGPLRATAAPGFVQAEAAHALAEKEVCR